MTWRGRCKVLLWMLLVMEEPGSEDAEQFFQAAADLLQVSKKTLRNWASAWRCFEEDGPRLTPADTEGRAGADEPASGLDAWGKPLDYFRPGGGC